MNLQVKISLNLHGLGAVEGVQAIEEIEDEPVSNAVTKVDVSVCAYPYHRWPVVLGMSVHAIP